MIETRFWPQYPPLPLYPYSKWNVFRWFGNLEPIDTSYMPGSKWREFFWFFRNFMFNFFRFVVGFEDRCINVTGPAPVFTPTWFDVAPTRYGFKWSRIDIGPCHFPFVSYSGKRVVWYLGWLPSGGRLGAKFNFVEH